MSNDFIRIYRGLTQKFSSDYNISRTDAPHGYSTWTDSLELAKEYAADKGGYIYYLDLPKSELGKSAIDEDPKSETYGDRVLFFFNGKSCGLHGIKGKEVLVYTFHDLYDSKNVKELKNIVSANNRVNKNYLNKMSFYSKIIAKYRVVADVVQFPKKPIKHYDFKYDNKFLADDTPLTKQQLQGLKIEIKRMSDVIDQCDSAWDSDILGNVEEYLEKIIDRINRSSNDKTLKKAILKIVSHVKKESLPTTSVTENGVLFQTGKPVSFNYKRNIQSSKQIKQNLNYQQDIEPSGKYMVHDTTGTDIPEHWEKGKIHFKNPLVLIWSDTGRYDETSWKHRLFKVFNKTGKELSNKLKSLGYDAIVTVDKGWTSEIVKL